MKSEYIIQDVTSTIIRNLQNLSRYEAVIKKRSVLKDPFIIGENCVIGPKSYVGCSYIL